MQKEDLRVGLKVTYTSPDNTTENGIIKAFSGNNVWVVFHCNNQWSKYYDYTGQATNIEDLTKGWNVKY